MKPHAWRRKSLVLHKSADIANPQEHEYFGIAKYINDTIRNGGLSEHEDLICRKAIRLNQRTHQLKRMYTRFKRNSHGFSEMYAPPTPTPIEIIMMLMLNLPYRENLSSSRIDCVVEDVFEEFGYDAGVAEQVSVTVDGHENNWKVNHMELYGLMVSESMVKCGHECPTMHNVGFKEYWNINGTAHLSNCFTGAPASHLD